MVPSREADPAWVRADGAHAASAAHIIAAAETRAAAVRGMRACGIGFSLYVVSAVLPTLTLCTRNATDAAASLGEHL